jgi:glutamyl-tRNA synthetase
MPLLLPYWEKAGYYLDPVADREWLEELATLIGPSLVRLADAPEESRSLLTPVVRYDGEALAQLRQEGGRAIIEGVLEAITRDLTLEMAKTIVARVTKANGIKKGVVMKSLRAALMGELHGPDLLQSWVLLNRKGYDRPRLERALKEI